MCRKLKSVVVLVVTLCLVWTSFALNAFAAGTTTIAFSKPTINVGDTLTVTVRFKATEKMYAYEAMIKYDTKVLQFVEATNGPESASGVVQIAAGANSTTATETITFKAIASGTSNISVDQANYVPESDETVSLEGCSANVSVVDKSTTKSSDANLKYITPSAGSLTPKFSPNVTSYTITIPNSVTVLTLGAGTSHSGAEWDVEGSKNMKVGSNQRVIIVTAEDGTQKKYTLNITRLTEDGTVSEENSSEPEAPTETVSVTADGKDMIISNSFDTSNLFPGYSVNSHTYNDIEFPCIEKNGTKLLYLTDVNGENGDFYRLAEDGNFEKFDYVFTKEGFYEFLKPDSLPDGYSEISLNIDGRKVVAYQSNDPTVIEFALVYAKGPGGYVGFYRYDTIEHTLQRAIGAMVIGTTTSTDKTDDDANSDLSGGNFINNILALDTNTKIIAAAIVGIILLLVVAIIVLIVKISRPSVYEEEYEEAEEEDGGELEDFELITISDRDGEEETIE